MFCPKCGKEIPDQATFCPKCGATVSGAARSAAPETPSLAAQGQSVTAVKGKPPKKKRGKKVLIAAVLIVAALIAIPSLLSSLPGEPGDDDPTTTQPSPEPETPTDQDGTPEPMEQDSIAELLALIDKTEADLVETFQKHNDLDPLEHSDRYDQDGDGFIDDLEPYLDAFRQQNQVLEDFYARLLESQEQAGTFTITDAKLKRAVDEYFNLLGGAMAAYKEESAFYADYHKFYLEVVSLRPLEVDYYDDLAGYSEALSAWSEAFKAAYAGIFCPESARSEWEQYGALPKYCESVAEKVSLAVEHGDWLRLYSSENLMARYVMAESNQYGKIIDSINNEVTHVAKQGECEENLALEIHAYVELTPEEQAAYEFENIRTGELMLDYDTVDTIYPSLYNTYDAFAIIKAGCISGTRSIVVEAEIEGFTQQYRETFDLDSSYKAIYVKPPALTGELNLTVAKPAQLKITISEKDGALIEAKTFNITLKSITDFRWYSDEYGLATQDNILCYLTPEVKAITDLKVKAADQIGAMLGAPAKAFVGYQSYSSSWTEAANTYLQAAGLMNALNAMDVVYVNDSFTLSGEGQQHITLPADALANRSALCIETSLIVASALQSAGMHAFLVFPRGHAMVAVEAWNSGTFQGDYFLIETTNIAGSGDTEMFLANLKDVANGYIPANWQHEGEYGLREPIEYLSRSQWQDYVENYFEYVVDCNDSRLLGLTAFAN